MAADEFIKYIIRVAIGKGYTVEVNRYGQEQIDFGHKKLHAGHLKHMFPAIMDPCVRASDLINAVAPGRPCTHKPMKEILFGLKNQALKNS